MRTLTVGHALPNRAPQAPTARQKALHDSGPAVLVPRLVKYADADAALAGLGAQWARLADLTGQWNDLERRRVALEGKLSDPALADHPKRPEAEQRWADLWRERGERLALIEAQCVVVARIYAALPDEARASWPERWPAGVWAARDAIERRLGLLTHFDEVPF